MIEGVIALLLVAYCIIRFFKTRKSTILFLGAILLSFQLPLWPFFFPYAASAACLAGSAALFAFYDFYKKKDKLLLFYGLVLLYLSIINVIDMVNGLRN